ncbi:hypothetical protein BofuT4_uP127020.1 [Botrytis cinerea T4]|uniref:Uncharacterized protein n=1 Tax=Botryotinia fuckeliana (strain T4) TaxID=999810 RepID=G2YSQ6_BOTF4|nr:hypothetical protein BofuT4_uP127020.1 [Botrytis cinerea T4]
MNGQYYVKNRWLLRNKVLRTSYLVPTIHGMYLPVSLRTPLIVSVSK